ncbi:MAG: phosphoribosylanthranilate isomerase [Gammaproteobacteria bacterium]|nr:phosphoribosylanthranilate isomerase [Gammaproteobacteria bacterium]
MSGHSKPAFVTFTGVDDPGTVNDLRALSDRYPIEWGVLVDPDRNIPPFADSPLIRCLRHAGIRLSAHLCGTLAAAVVKGRPPQFEVAGFSRVQINHGLGTATAAMIDRVGRYAACHGLRAALQCSGAFPLDGRVDWLYDISFGTGVQPGWFPPVDRAHPFCGVSGGIGPDNIVELLSSRLSIAADVPFWIDMESGVRTDGKLDLDKCAAVCAAIYG